MDDFDNIEANKNYEREATSNEADVKEVTKWKLLLNKIKTETDKMTDSAKEDPQVPEIKCPECTDS